MWNEQGKKQGKDRLALAHIWPHLERAKADKIVSGLTKKEEACCDSLIDSARLDEDYR